MTSTTNLIQQWQAYSPTKGMLLASCATGVVLTLLLGFTWGGWVTEGTANERAAQAATQARAELASAVCVERFLAAADVSKRLFDLKAASFWERDQLIENAGWATPPGLDAPVDDAAELCANQLAQMEIPPSSDVKPTAAVAQ